MSPGETVAIVRNAFACEVKKWRTKNDREDTAYSCVVWRPGYALGEMPPLDEKIDSVTYFRGKTYEEATEIIANAGWTAAVEELEKCQSRS